MFDASRLLLVLDRPGLAPDRLTPSAGVWLRGEALADANTARGAAALAQHGRGAGEPARLAAAEVEPIVHLADLPAEHGLQALLTSDFEAFEATMVGLEVGRFARTLGLSLLVGPSLHTALGSATDDGRTNDRVAVLAGWIDGAQAAGVPVAPTLPAAAAATDRSIQALGQLLGKGVEVVALAAPLFPERAEAWVARLREELGFDGVIVAPPADGPDAARCAADLGCDLLAIAAPAVLDHENLTLSADPAPDNTAAKRV
ncbi:MAG: hypothetical protein AAGN46_06465, partial [Acidobacteriota bacterium]